MIRILWVWLTGHNNCTKQGTFWCVVSPKTPCGMYCDASKNRQHSASYPCFASSCNRRPFPVPMSSTLQEDKMLLSLVSDLQLLSTTTLLSWDMFRHKFLVQLATVSMTSAPNLREKEAYMRHWSAGYPFHTKLIYECIDANAGTFIQENKYINFHLFLQLEEEHDKGMVTTNKLWNCK